MYESSKLERPLKRLLSRGSNEGLEIAELLAAYVSSSSNPQEEVHSFLHHTSEVIARCLLRNPERFQIKTATTFFEESLKLIHRGPELLSMSVEDFLDDGINDIFVALDRILGPCRYRLYIIDPKEMCYRGLKSVGMYPEYSQEFDVEQATSFNKTKLIPFAEPPFKQLDLTKCFVLYDDDLSQIADDSREWYFRHLGLGNRPDGIPETYTWEFTVDGVAQNLCRFAPEPDRFSYSLAFSMDAGGSSGLDYKDRKLDLWLISLLDVLWSSSFGRDLGAYLGYVTHGLSSQIAEDNSIPREVAARKPQPIVNKVSLREAEVSWNVNPIFIGTDTEPWVGAENDEVVEDLFRQYENLRNHRSYVIALGPSGSGKEVFLRALHNDGESTGGGPITTVNCLVTLDGRSEDAEVAINGAERHAYTGAQASDGPIEGFLQANDGGSVILDELLALPSDKQMRLRSVLANLQKKPPVGFTRRGGSAILVPNVRVMATGKVGQLIDSDLKRRFPEVVRIPSWYELNTQSRIAVLRWHIETHLSLYGFRNAKISSQLFQFLVGDDVVPALAESNMGFVKNYAIVLFEANLRGSTAELSLKKLANKLETYGQTKVIVEELVRNRDEDFPDELLIGENSGFERTFPSKLKLGFKISQCNDWKGCKGCIDIDDMNTLSAAKKETVWDLLYFLYAAVWWREINSTLRGGEEDKTLASKKDDGDLTGAEIVERHFGKANYQMFVSWLANETGFTPYQFRCTTRSRYLGYLKLKEFVMTISNKRRLLALTHLMKCAAPNFVNFPFWEQTIAQPPTVERVVSQER